MIFLRKFCFCCAVFALCVFRAGLAEAAFLGVSENHWAYQAVLRLYNDGLIKPDGAKQFNLEQKITVSEFVGLIGGVSPNFLSENALAPGALLTRGQMALIVQNALGLKTPDDAWYYAAQIRDYADAWDNYKDALLACYVNGIIVGADGFMRPAAHTSRAEAFVTLYKCEYPQFKTALAGDEALFYITEIPETVKKLMYGVTISDASLVAFSDLRRISVAHYGYDGLTHAGVLIMHKDIAGEVLEIFKILYDNKFPIEKMRLPDLYGGSDDLSMADNNTSGFNDRPISATRRSYHQFGLAVDINPLQNPYYYAPTKEVSPEEAAPFLDRTKSVKGYITPGGICVKTFKEKGWRWGGDWINEKDYQHFDKTTVMDIKTYAPPANAKKPSEEIFFTG